MDATWKGSGVLGSVAACHAWTGSVKGPHSARAAWVTRATFSVLGFYLGKSPSYVFPAPWPPDGSSPELGGGGWVKCEWGVVVITRRETAGSAWIPVPAELISGAEEDTVFFPRPWAPSSPEVGEL